MAEYKDTLNLPQTDFPMRAGLAQREPGMMDGWEARGLYHRLHELQFAAPPAAATRSS